MLAADGVKLATQNKKISYFTFYVHSFNLVLQRIKHMEVFSVIMKYKREQT
jgi:hypothetical protein